MEKNYKIGEKVRITMHDKDKERYFPDYLWDRLGLVWQIDDDHIWIDPVRGSICRYELDSVSIEVLSDTFCASSSERARPSYRTLAGIRRAFIESGELGENNFLNAEGDFDWRYTEWLENQLLEKEEKKNK